MTLLPVALLSSPLVSVPRQAAVRLLALAIVYPALMAAASPVIALVIHREGVPNYGSHYQLIARAMERAWNGRTDKPLRIVGSDAAIVNGIVFYFANLPSTLDIIDSGGTPWVDSPRSESRRGPLTLVRFAHSTSPRAAVVQARAEIG